MIDSGRNWELFGYDTRNLAGQFFAAWRDLLWAYDSPVRERLDEAVALRSAEGEHIYQAGVENGACTARCHAVLIPEELVLARRLRIPLAAEAELEDALRIEAVASSPFSPDDTGIGWLISARDERFLHVHMVIVSLSAVMTYVGQHFDSHDAHAQEVWVAAGERMVVVRGFGEGQRESLYRRRLLRVGGLMGVAAILLLAVLLTGAGLKKWELERLTALEETTRAQAAEALRLRSSLGQANETIAAVNEVTAYYPNPHAELARITHLLGDDAYLEKLSTSGREMELRGKAENAARVMELLTEQPQYSGVSAASAIRKLSNSSLEQFHLKVELRGADI